MSSERKSGSKSDDEQSTNTFIDKALSPLKDKEGMNGTEHTTESNENGSGLVKKYKTNRRNKSAQKESLILMTSILKYIDSQTEMDTIHRACFNLWKDWYRCYGSIQNQFQTAFMAVCEQLLGNVDSRALKRDAPITLIGISSVKTIEQITYDLSKQISTLKHAFAIEQLQQSSKKCKQSVPQVTSSFGTQSKTFLLLVFVRLSMEWNRTFGG